MSRIVVVACVLLCASTGHGFVTTYTDSSSFLAALPGSATTLDFESTAAGTTLPSGSTLEGITFTYSLPPEMLLIINEWNATSGENSLGLTGGDYALLDGDVFALAVASPINALGLFVITSEAAVADEIQLVTSEGTAFNAATEEMILADGGMVYFIGLISDTPFSSATLDFADDGESNFAYNVDDIVTAVPEPSMFVLHAAALLALTGMGRRRLR